MAAPISRYFSVRGMQAVAVCMCAYPLCTLLRRRLRHADILEAAAVAANGSRRGANVVGQKEPEVDDRPIATSSAWRGGQSLLSWQGRQHQKKEEGRHLENGPLVSLARCKYTHIVHKSGNTSNVKVTVRPLSWKDAHFLLAVNAQLEYCHGERQGPHVTLPFPSDWSDL